MKQVLKFTPEFILACYILLFLFFKNPGLPWDRSINSDGKGYYAYLPAIFIYHDLTYKFVESYEDKYYPPDRSVFKEFRSQADGKTTNKCFPGLAILWLPFFLVAHLLSALLGFPTDGYSPLYQYAISIAALFYLWLGCRFLLKLLIKTGASVKTAAFITFIIAFGTNIMYYAVVEDSMTHVYSFFLITIFLYYVYRYFHDRKGKHFILSTILFGLIVLVRPTNGLILLLLPLMVWLAHRGSRIEDRELRTEDRELRTEDRELRTEDRESRIESRESSIEHRGSRIEDRESSIQHPASSIQHLSIGILLFLLLLSIPVILWYYTTGHFFVYQYGEERFHFLHPHFFSILFSYNRGWFVYTPVALVSVFGFLHLWKENKNTFAWTLSFFIIFIYAASCWWMWYYASKCGQRIFVDLYAIVAILLLFLYFFFQKRKFLRYLLTSLLILFTGLNVFQCYQHSCFIFPATYITSEIYWDSFSRLHPAARVYLPQEAVISTKSFFTDMEKPEGWENPWTIRGPFGFSGKHCSLITHKHPYSVGRYETLAPLFTTPNRIIRVSAMVWSADSTSGSTLVVETRSGEEKLSYNSFYLATYVQADQWTRLEAAFYVLRDIPENSVAKIYFFNNTRSVPLFIDDMTIDFLSLKDEVQYTRMEGIQLPVK
jgi:hypothetical protein